MRVRWTVWLVAAGIAVAAPSGTIPRAADGKPSLSGVWDIPYVPDMSKTGRPSPGGTPGNSVGHWEEDTLVIDTIGFNEKTRLDTIGHPHSSQLHVVERLTRTDSTHMTYEVTVTDAKAYTEPFTNQRIFTLKPDWELMEYSCEENNKEVTEGHIK